MKMRFTKKHDETEEQKNKFVKLPTTINDDRSDSDSGKSDSDGESSKKESNIFFDEKEVPDWKELSFSDKIKLFNIQGVILLVSNI